MPAADVRAEIERVLEQGAAQAKAAIDASIERARELLLTQDRDLEAPAEAAPVPPKWLSLEQAAPIRGVTRQTMAIHAERFGLGTFSNRRWRIDENRLRALNEGRPYQKLNPFPDGET